VFAIKRDEKGNVKMHKARLVARGFTQQYGVDYFDTFAPVMKLKSLRLILAISATNKLRIIQLDVKTAFLNAPVTETIYIHTPEGIEHTPNTTLILLRAPYGIKQASREWNKLINGFLISIQFM